MPPPVAVSGATSPRTCPSPPTRRRRPIRIRSTSLAHVAGLVRAAVPPMHPGGRPIVGGVAAAAGPRPAPSPAAAPWSGPWPRPPPPRSSATRTACRRRDRGGAVGRRRHGRARRPRCARPPSSDLPRRAAAARQRLPVGARRARPAHPGRRPRRRRRSTGRAGSCPPTWTRPARTTSATPCCIGDRRRAAGRRRADRRSAGPADRLRRRGGRRGGRGETYGLIRFGSRVDTYLPAGAEVAVERGQRTIGGETVLAEAGVHRAARACQLTPCPAVPAAAERGHGPRAVLGASAVNFALGGPLRPVRRGGRRRGGVRRARRPPRPAARRQQQDRRRARLAVRPGRVRRRARAGALHLGAATAPGSVGSSRCVFAVCMALRLARFNTLLDAERPPAVRQGVLRRRAAPGRALLAGLPLLLWLQLRDGLVVGAVDGRGCGRWSSRR